MKLFIRIGAAIVLLFTSAMTAQTEVHFDESGLQSVLNRAKTQHKPVFYMLYASWCPHCTKMKAEVFKDSTVANFMNKNFVCAWQDIEKGEGSTFKKKYNVKMFPSFLFVDENGKTLYQFNGEYKTSEFLAEAKIALDPKKQLPYLEKEFYADLTNGDKCIAFLTTLKKGSDRTALNPHAQKYLATQTDAQLVSEKNWKIIANGVTDIESHPFQYVLQHQKEFAGVSSEKRVQKKLFYTALELLQPYTENLDTIRYQKDRAIAKTIPLQKIDSLVFRCDIVIAEKTKNWTAYKKAANESAEKYIWSDAKTLTEISNNYALHIADPSSLKYAIKWMQHVLDLKETYAADMAIAKLYRKTNDVKSALIFAQKAKDFNAGFGFNTKEADNLLAELGAK